MIEDISPIIANSNNLHEAPSELKFKRSRSNAKKGVSPRLRKRHANKASKPQTPSYRYHPKVAKLFSNFINQALIMPALSKSESKVFKLLQEVTSQPFNQLIKVSPAAFLSASQCVRWHNTEQLFDEITALSHHVEGLVDLSPKAYQTAKHPYQAKTGITYPYVWDIQDSSSDLTLRLYYKNYGCTLELGFIEEKN